MKKINKYKSELAGFKATNKIIDYIRCKKSGDPSDWDTNELKPHLPIQQSMAEIDSTYCHKLSSKLKERVNEKCLDYVEQLWVSVTEYLYL